MSDNRDVAWKVIGRDISDAEAGSRVREFFGGAEALEVVFQLDKILAGQSDVLGESNLLNVGSDDPFIRGCVSDDRCKRFISWLKENIGGVYGSNGVYSRALESDRFSPHLDAASDILGVHQKWNMRYLLGAIHDVLFVSSPWGFHAFEPKKVDQVDWDLIISLIRDGRFDFWHPKISHYICSLERDGKRLANSTDFHNFLIFLVALWKVPVHVLRVYDERNRVLVSSHVHGGSDSCCRIESEHRDGQFGAACFVYQENAGLDAKELMRDDSYRFLLEKFRNSDSCIDASRDIGYPEICGCVRLVSVEEGHLYK